MRSYILDENDEPVLTDALTAARWMEENWNNRRVAYTRVDDAYLSTVFLILDHNFSFFEGNLAGHVPILYESLWFGGEHDGIMRRYATKQEALAGHKSMLKEAYPNCWELFELEPKGIFDNIGRLLPKNT